MSNHDEEAPKAEAGDFQSEFAALVKLVGQGVKDPTEQEKEEFLKGVTIKAPVDIRRRPQSKWAKVKSDLGLELNLTAILGIFFLCLSIGFAALIEWRDSTTAKRIKARTQAFDQTSVESIDIFNTIASTGGNNQAGQVDNVVTGEGGNLAIAQNPADQLPNNGPELANSTNEFEQFDQMAWLDLTTSKLLPVAYQSGRPAQMQELTNWHFLALTQARQHSTSLDESSEQNLIVAFSSGQIGSPECSLE